MNFTTFPYNSDHSLKDLTLALTSTARASETCYLNTRFLIKRNFGCIFHFGENTKTSKKGKLRNSIKLIPFYANKNRCVCHQIDSYLEKNEGVAQNRAITSLKFRCSTSRSININNIRLDNHSFKFIRIDARTFTSHSTRSASSSKAKESSVPTAEILNKRYWSRSSTFGNFHHKKILPEEVNFLLTIQKSFKERS